jgi:hypothetical protein
MKLGLLSDIHEATGPLRQALGHFRAAGVEQVVVLGDVVDRGIAVEETTRLLAEAGAVGVWGNHDLGLCREPSESLRQAYSAEALAFMASLRPRLEVGECHFSHVEPWLDPEEPFELWYDGGPPARPEALERTFAAVPHRLLFVGHFHRWLAATPAGVLPWQGEAPLPLQAGRFLVALGAVCDGHCACYDTETLVLQPASLPCG